MYAGDDIKLAKMFDGLDYLQKDVIKDLVYGVDYTLQYDAIGNVEVFFLKANETTDNINHPSHYTHYQGIEVIDLTEQMNFNRGNAVKYLCRAGHKEGASEIEDLKKAAWYVQREIQRLEKPDGR
jgi:hypothetical protein